METAAITGNMAGGAPEEKRRQKTAKAVLSRKRKALEDAVARDLDEEDVELAREVPELLLLL